MSIPSDKEYLSDKEINELSAASSSGPMFASNLMLKIFSAKEFFGCNVEGRGVLAEDIKAPLDPRKIAYIKILLINSLIRVIKILSGLIVKSK